MIADALRDAQPKSKYRVRYRAPLWIKLLLAASLAMLAALLVALAEGSLVRVLCDLTCNDTAPLR